MVKTMWQIILILLLAGCSTQSPTMEDNQTENLPPTLQVLGEEHWLTAGATNLLGFLYSEQGRYEEAEPLHLRSVELSRRALGEDHWMTLWSMYGLAQFQGKRGQESSCRNTR